MKTHTANLEKRLMRRILDMKVDSAKGIVSICNWRFWTCLLALIVSACALARDPMFFDIRVGFRFGSGILCIVVSYLVLSALFWELLLFGKPRGANLFLQWAALVPFSLFVGRIFAKPTVAPGEGGQTILGVAWDCVKFAEREIIGLSNIIGKILPDWVMDIFSHWSIAMVLVFVVAALCFRKRSCKVGLLFAAFLVGIAGALSVHSSWQLIVGALALVTAFAMMFNPYDEQCFYCNWINELSREPVNSVELDVVSKVMSEMYKRGRLTYEEVGELIMSRLSGIKCEDDAVRSGARKFVNRLLRLYNFVSLTGDSTGVYLTVNPRLLSYNTLMYALAIYPRRLIVAMIGIVWLVSPLDIVPDAIPFFGVLDDAAIAILSAKSIMTSRR